VVQLLAEQKTYEGARRSHDHGRHWRRLQEARHFRVEQLAELGRQSGATPRHEGVQRALRVAAQTALAEIDAALERIAEGSYGRCVRCARPMPADRLEVLPMAALCMPCHYKAQNPGRSAQG
jgi:RNA polymerase-binding transcription factor DksA